MPPKRGSHALKAISTYKRRKATLLSLPDELIVDVLSYLTQADTLSLLYTSKHFERPAKIRLYRDIVICEKPNDDFFRTMVDLQGKTLLSSWPAILSFFSMIFKQVKLGSPPMFLSYVESISSYNYLDSGKVDAYKSLSSDDLQNILKLRQMFDPVIESLPNLKSLQTPLIPLQKLQLLKPSTLAHLQVLSFTINMESPPENIPHFDNIHTLTINICSREPPTKEAMKTLFKNCPQLQHLEINGNFGRLDRVMEHSLRHSSVHEELSPRAQYINGYLAAVNDEKKSSGTRPSKLKSSALERYVNERGPGREDNVDDRYGWFDNQKTQEAIACQKLDQTLLEGIRDFSLVTFRLKNFILPEFKEDDDRLWLEVLLKRSIECKSLKDLEFSNCTDVLTRPEVITLANMMMSPQMLEYDGLKRLTLFNLAASGDWKRPTYDDYFRNVTQSFSSCTMSQLKELNICGGSELMPLREELISYTQGFKSLKKLTFSSLQSQEEVCQRVITCKCMLQSYTRGNFSDLDDDLFLHFRNLIEHMNYTNRMERYGQHGGSRESTWIKKFKREFFYLFGKEVERFFIEIPSLEEFVLYGVPFKREMFSNGGLF